jgi:hypothetical protein
LALSMVSDVSPRLTVAMSEVPASIIVKLSAVVRS